MATSYQERTVAYPQDYSHLNGEIVQVVRNGDIFAVQTVSGGVLTGTGDVNHIGLAFTSTAKPMKLDIEGMGIILTKKITKAIVSFYKTLRGQVGTSPTAMETVQFGIALFSGIKEVPMNGGYDKSGDVIILQDEPMPLICRGMILETGVYNK